MLLPLIGCVSTYHAFEHSASRSGLERTEVQGRGFRHALYRRPTDRRDAVGPVHVYLTGDGRPYIRPSLVAGDPTPRHPVVPALLAMDQAQAMILGRPCYHGYADSPSCSERLWTHARYGEEVVASMAEALSRAVPAGRELVLIGFSGGGALAMLLAGRVPGAVAVVTLAGNLDTDAWADTHGYTRLQASMNPVEAAPLPAGLIQLHYAGTRDKQVPPALLREAVRRAGGDLRVLPDTTHHRGWDRHWVSILAEL